MNNPSFKTEQLAHHGEGQLDEAGRIAVHATLGWSGWGSPVGLSFLTVSAGFFLLCLHWAGILH